MKKCFRLVFESCFGARFSGTHKMHSTIYKLQTTLEFPRKTISENNLKVNRKNCEIVEVDPERAVDEGGPQGARRGAYCQGAGEALGRLNSKLFPFSPRYFAPACASRRIRKPR